MVSMNKPAVLYVEDDLQSRKIMEIILRETMGLMQVAIFEDSTDFLTRVKALGYKPDVIFLDIHMQPINGFQMLNLLTAETEYQQIPVVALTASVMNEEVALLRKSGFRGVIPKPLDMDTFPDSLQRILNGEHLWRIMG
jgi:CheY-like chemotaxis protein